MATVKITCPKCTGDGLTGNASAVVCSQCLGKGYITADDSQTLATVNTTVASNGGTAVVVTAAVAHPQAALKVIGRDK